MTKGAFSRQSFLRVLEKRDFQWTIMVFLFLYYPLIFYFGELVDYAGWEALRWEFFYGVHDIHRLFFVVPLIYAGYVFRVKGAIIVTIASLIVFVPRAFVLSPFPDPITRTVIFSVVAGGIGVLTGMIHNQSEQRRHFETVVRSQQDKLQGLLDRMEEGVLIVGPDYRIRFMNSTIAREFGEDGTGSPCFKYLQGLDIPCGQICKLPNVINGRTERWEYKLPDGRTYEVLASPYVDSDGAVCQLTTFRKV